LLRHVVSGPAESTRAQGCRGPSQWRAGYQRRAVCHGRSCRRARFAASGQAESSPSLTLLPPASHSLERARLGCTPVQPTSTAIHRPGLGPGHASSTGVVGLRITTAGRKVSRRVDMFFFCLALASSGSWETAWRNAGDFVALLGNHIACMNQRDGRLAHTDVERSAWSWRIE